MGFTCAADIRLYPKSQVAPIAAEAIVLISTLCSRFIKELPVKNVDKLPVLPTVHIAAIHVQFCCDIHIRTDKSADLRLIITALQIVHSRLFINSSTP